MVKSERGVTLVELIITLAIAGLLATSLLFGRDQFTTSQQFSQGVDVWVQTLEQARGEAANTVGQLTGGGSDAQHYIYGKTVGISCNPPTLSNTLSVNTVTAWNATGSANDDTVFTFSGADNYNAVASLAFLHDPCNGPSQKLLILFAFQPGGNVAVYSGEKIQGVGFPPTINLTQATAGNPVTIHIYNPSNPNFHATIIIDQYGNVTRSITL